MIIEDLKAMLDQIAFDALSRAGVKVVRFTPAASEERHVYTRVTSNCEKCGQRFTQSDDCYSKFCYSCRPKDDGLIWNKTQPDPPMFEPAPRMLGEVTIRFKFRGRL